VSVVVLAVLGTGVWFLMAPRSSITQANADKIQEGMTLEEVETILGGPARDEATELTAFHAIDIRSNTVVTNPPRDWVTDRVVVRVRFDPLGRVGDVVTLDNARLRESRIDVVRRWMGL
jgi:outer membrane protein assembly factor BamE (lipoprotein component of BamABCDE complex)